MQLNRQQQGTVEYIKPEKIKDGVVLKEKKQLRQKILEWLNQQKKLGKKPKHIDIVSTFGFTGQVNFIIRQLIDKKIIVKKHFECKSCHYYELAEPKKAKNVRK